MTKTPEQDLSDRQVNERHKRRIDNLKAQLMGLSKTILDVEMDAKIPENLKAKRSDKIVQQMTLIEHEIAIREKLISWL